MRTQRDYYEILGLPHTATAAEIKRKYRELARKFHPDVVKDKTLGHKAFTQITEAYKTLSDPDLRRQYDATRVSTSPPTRQSYQQTQSRTPGGRTTPPPTVRPVDPGKLVRDAEYAFINKRLQEATNLCRQAIRLNRQNARAHVILGDIYRIQGRKEQAEMEYTYAVQFNPADRETQAKLEKLLGRAAPKARRPQPPSRRRSGRHEYAAEIRSARNTANMVGWGMAFFLLFLVNLYPGTPIPALKFIAPVSTWSWSLVGILSLDAALVAVLLCTNHLLGDPDEELFFQYMPGTMIPIGFPLIICSFVFFYGAAAGILVISVLQGNFSKSLLVVFGVVVAITLLAALMYEPGRDQVALYGGNVTFPAAVIGWYIGRLFGPLDK